MSHFGTKVIPGWMITGSSGSEQAASTTIPEENIDPVKDFKLMDSSTELNNAINSKVESHLRPMSDAEYNQYVGMLASQKDSKGNLLFKHDLAAISRVVKENFKKFFPDIALDYNITNSLEFHYEVDHIMTDMYNDAVEKFRAPFINTKAEAVKDNYSPDEIIRLRERGIAFTGDNYKVYDAIETMIQESGDTMRKGFIKRSYQHPLLKYNLIKAKGL